jgi:putative nucleotidyltransferase with HDIG domain
MIQTMISVVEAKDPYTRGHCLRVQRLTRRLLEGVENISDEVKAKIETTALLHDIGKIGIPDNVLLKKGKLTREQVAVLRSHVLVGERILRHHDSLRDVSRWVRHHHEQWSGLGYPDGLRGEAIPLPSRIIAVADAVDAMLTERPYRKALSIERTREAIREGRGTQFDPAVADRAVALLSALEEEPAGEPARAGAPPPR